MLKQRKLSKEATPLSEGMGWLRDYCHEKGGFFVETEHHMIAYAPGRDRLIACFDNRHSALATEMRVPFGFPFMVKQGWGVLGVMVKRTDWFQCPDLKERLIDLRDLGLFKSYPDVAFYGSSMGGFGAMLFAPLAPGAKVLAFAPQSTLRPRVVKFERRYMTAFRRGDWSGEFTDVAKNLEGIGKAYVIYDPRVPEDCAHAERMQGSNILHLPVRHFTHKLPPMFKRMEILKPVAHEALTGAMTSQSFYHLLRARREAAPYLFRLVDNAREAGHIKLGQHAAELAVTKVDNWKTRKALNRMRAARRAQQASKV